MNQVVVLMYLPCDKIVRQRGVLMHIIVDLTLFVIAGLTRNPLLIKQENYERNQLCILYEQHIQ